jgi:hypothetical protein
MGNQDEELARRRSLSFEQAEGAEKLPSQLATTEVTQQLRSYVWAVVHASLEKYRRSDTMGYGGSWFNDPWATILKEKHVVRDHRMADEFVNDARKLTDDLKGWFARGNYTQIYGTIQWVLRHRMCPPDLAPSIEIALERSHSAFRLFDRNTIAPISDEHEAAALRAGLADASAAGMPGPKKQALAEGEWADSIRDSIHAVESAAKLVVPDASSLGPALDALAKSGKLHGAMRKGFDGLYGFTSDEKGIRHSLLEKAEVEVDEADAQFMLSACAAFVSYLLARARN